MGSSDGRAYRRTQQLHDGYRRRNDVFLIALLVSLALHAATIMLAPGFRRPAFKIAQTMNVLLMPPAAPVPQPRATPAPPEGIPSPPSPPQPEVRPEQPVPPQPEPDITPQNAAETQSPQLALKPAPVPKSAPIPKPEPKPAPAPKPKTEPKQQPEPKPARRPTRPEAVKKPPPRRAAESPVRHHAAPTVPASPPSTTVSPQPAAPPVTVTSQQPALPIDDLLDRYGKNLARIVAGGQHYPRIAQMRGWQGTVEIAVTVAPPGKADTITIQRSSGHPVLDDEALDMVKRALPLPEPPAPLRDRRFTVVVPIVFRLR